jgi:multidrug efflux pump subunit AcrA (membrane-fusion protein)
MIDRRPLLALSALLVLSACGKKDTGEESDVTPVVTVETAQVRTAAFAPTVRAVGTVVSSPTGYAELSAPAPSRVARVLVTAGQSVKAGEALIELDAAALRAAQTRHSPPRRVLTIALHSLPSRESSRARRSIRRVPILPRPRRPQ